MAGAVRRRAGSRLVRPYARASVRVDGSAWAGRAGTCAPLGAWRADDDGGGVPVVGSPSSAPAPWLGVLACALFSISCVGFGTRF